MKYKIFSKVSDESCILNKNTGELTDLVQKRKIMQDDFILVFLSTIPEFFSLNGGEIKLMMALWRLSTFNPQYSNDGNIVVNNPNTKDKIRKMGLNVSDAVIDNGFSKLSKIGCIIKQCKGMYLLNPKFFFKGTLSDATNMQLIFSTKD